MMKALIIQAKRQRINITANVGKSILINTKQHFSSYNLVADALMSSRYTNEKCSAKDFGKVVVPDKTLLSGYNVQKMMINRYSNKHIGWKVGATNAGAQNNLKITEPFRAPLFDKFIETSTNAKFEVDKWGIRGVEAEFSFVLRKDLPARDHLPAYGKEEIWDAVEYVIPSIEVCASRYLATKTPVDVNLFLADFGGHGSLVLGPNRLSKEEAMEIKLDQVAVKMIKNSTLIKDGTGGDVMGDPILALTWIANHLSAAKIGLKKGHTICTGTCTGLTPVEAGDKIVTEFAGLGDVTVSF